ncbi:hypothetical protein B0T21DRAFT_375725 [Apiosordaria backusii]|uniref:CDP-diacylglycerol--serine O-phosphatidyltransferase n=1 Tax=Apiosordaria backusii TaxID=314023 RepID=A0AA40DSY0_9PEZI|nr:hypothetical protein B0T21DRAFT_375725 [Apiosordaria backusii]
MSKRTSVAATGSASSSSGNDATISKPPTLKDNKQDLLLSSDVGHFSLVRALHLADLITELNGLCGILSVFSSLRYCIATGPLASALNTEAHSTLYWALGFLPLGLFFDFFDGKVARWRKKSSMMGQELDSLADLISFGVAPASAAFAMGLRTPVDHLLLGFFVLCGLTRLARFNVTATAIPKDATGKAKYFEGTPIPTTLALDAVMAYWISKGWIHEALPLGTLFTGTILEFHPVAVVFALHGCLMCSKTIHIPKP